MIIVTTVATLLVSVSFALNSRPSNDVMPVRQLLIRRVTGQVQFRYFKFPVTAFIEHIQVAPAIRLEACSKRFVGVYVRSGANSYEYLSRRCSREFA